MATSTPPPPPLPPKVAFGLRLRELRIAAGLSQEGLGDLANLDRTYISSCERGRRNVTLEAIHKLAEALKVAPKVLLETPIPPQDMGDK